MKCPRCNGDGSVPYHIADDLFDETNCPLCGGSGEVITEQEHVQTCNTEQLAEWIVSTNRCKKDHLCSVCRQKWCDKNYVVEWLKQPHKE